MIPLSWVHGTRKNGGCVMVYQKDNIFVLTPLHGGPRAGRRGPFLARKSAFFYATPMKPPFFRLRRSRLNGIISPPYPEVTLDTFGFPVGGRLAARRTVSWPRLPKVALSGPKNAVFWPEIIFLCPASKKIVTIIAGHLKDNLFVSPHCRVVSRGPSGPIFGPKNGPKI